MPPRSHTNHGSLGLKTTNPSAFVMDHPLPSSRKSNRRARQRKHSSMCRNIAREESQPIEEKVYSPKDRSETNVKKFFSGKMRLFPLIPMSCRKKHAGGMKDDEDTSIDPLATVIEEAKNLTCSKRVRLVTFNLDKNQVVDESIESPRPMPESNNGPMAVTGSTQIVSILSPSTTSSNRDPSDIKELLRRVIFDSDGESKEVALRNRGVDKTDIVNTASRKDVTVFKVDKTLTSKIKDIIRKGGKYQKSYNYAKAAKCFLQALKKIDHNAYPQDHPLREIVNKSISDTHYSHRSLEHSANIVKIGLSNESKGYFVKALKMYTVAFRIRKDSLGDGHPSLPILLNLLGSVQVKRGQYEEAMQLFELALYGKLKNDTETVVGDRTVSASTLAVSMKEIGSIHEHFGRLEEAMVMYHESLDCVLKDARRVQEKNSQKTPASSEKVLRSPSICSTVISDESYDVCVVSASTPSTSSTLSSNMGQAPQEMEIYLQESFSGDPQSNGRSLMHLAFFYDSFFQITQMKNKKVNLHVASTLHSIASIHLKQHEYNLALSSYHASLRGMKVVHGERHESVAAVLGNIGNLLKEMKDYDRAFDIYQSVLKIESARLGITHDNVVITKLNIAMIEKCRRHYDASISIYKEVIVLQRAKHEDDGEQPNLLTVSLSCLGDVYERKGDFESAIETFKDMLVIQATALSPFHPDLGKILHKLGLLCSESDQLLRADSYFTKALRIYQKSGVKDEEMVAVKRDKADNMSKLSLLNAPVKNI